MREREVVDIHEVSAAKDGWRVLVYQTPQPLFLPASRTELYQRLERAGRDDLELTLTWDSESLEILEAE